MDTNFISDTNSSFERPVIIVSISLVLVVSVLMLIPFMSLPARTSIALFAEEPSLDLNNVEVNHYFALCKTEDIALLHPFVSAAVVIRAKDHSFNQQHGFSIYQASESSPSEIKLDSDSQEAMGIASLEYELVSYDDSGAVVRMMSKGSDGEILEDRNLALTFSGETRLVLLRSRIELALMKLLGQKVTDPVGQVHYYNLEDPTIAPQKPDVTRRPEIA